MDNGFFICMVKIHTILSGNMECKESDKNTIQKIFIKNNFQIVTFKKEYLKITKIFLVTYSISIIKLKN